MADPFEFFREHRVQIDEAVDFIGDFSNHARPFGRQPYREVSFFDRLQDLQNGLIMTFVMNGGGALPIA